MSDNQHIKQNDSQLKPRIQEIGCFYRSCGLVAEYFTGCSLTAEQLNDGWNWAHSKGFINGKDDIVTSAPIIEHFSKLLDPTLQGRMLEVGLFKDGVVQYYPAAPLRRFDFLIQKIRQNGPNKYHFRMVNKRGELIEDPHDPVINVTGIDYSILYAWKEM